ncbi:hypothetical protein GGF46_004908 [Coemansia sp. RSA 552]|nr:hypothetical protein GGF46_004908 [Coemansia sp. RSA 552]
MATGREHTTIAQDIAESLRTLPAGSELAVRVVHTADHPVDSLTPRRRLGHFHAENTLSRRVLVLVSQNNCFVAGIEAHEFTTLLAQVDGRRAPQASISVNTCIEKVDTSGVLAKRMPLVRALVAGYLRSLQKYARALAIPFVGVHLFARSQPEYLFAKSQENTGKHALGDMALIKWWKRTLDHALAYATAAPPSTGDSQPKGTATTVTAYCVIPGASANSRPAFLDEHGSSAVGWHWGLPHPIESLADNCVLQFPDDPMTRLLAEPHSKEWSVSMLLEMLAVTEECGSGRRTAYFSADMPISAPACPEASNAASTADQGSLTFEEYDQILTVLFDREMDFSSLDAATKSSERVTEYLSSQFGITPAVVTTDGQDAVQALSAAAGVGSPPPVNDLSTAIRKRRKTSK